MEGSQIVDPHWDAIEAEDSGGGGGDGTGGVPREAVKSSPHIRKKYELRVPLLLEASDTAIGGTTYPTCPFPVWLTCIAIYYLSLRYPTFSSSFSFSRYPVRDVIIM